MVSTLHWQNGVDQTLDVLTAKKVTQKRQGAETLATVHTNGYNTL